MRHPHARIYARVPYARVCARCARRVREHVLPPPSPALPLPVLSVLLLLWCHRGSDLLNICCCCCCDHAAVLMLPYI